MPDLQNFAIAPAGAGKYSISYQICDTNTGAVLVDHTGANQLLFPDQFTGSSVIQQLQFVQMWAMDVIRARDPGQFT